jgi:hypothetical protein
MSKKVFFSLICLFHFLTAFTQSLDKNEIYHLQALIINFLSDQDNMPNAKTKRSSEFMVCLLQLDSSGKIYNIYIFSDDKNKDSTYSYLSRMTPIIFNGWKSEKCKGKTLLMPVVSIAHGKSPAYMKNLIDERYVKPIGVISETNKLIIVTPLQYAPPYTERENPPEQEKRIDKVKKDN